MDGKKMFDTTALMLAYKSNEIKDRQFFAIYIKRLGKLMRKWYLREEDDERKEKFRIAMVQCHNILKDFEIYQGEYIEQEISIDDIGF